MEIGFNSLVVFFVPCLRGNLSKRLCSSPRGYFQDTCSVRTLALFSIMVVTTCCQLQLAQPQHLSRHGVCCCCRCPELVPLVRSLAPSEACQLAGRTRPQSHRGAGNVAHPATLLHQSPQQMPHMSGPSTWTTPGGSSIKLPDMVEDTSSSSCAHPSSTTAL